MRIAREQCRFIAECISMYPSRRVSVVCEHMAIEERMNELRKTLPIQEVRISANEEWLFNYLNDEETTWTS